MTSVDVRDMLSIERPVIQAAMGGVSRSELVTAVAKAGGLGSLGYLPPQLFDAEISQIREELDGRTYAVNLLLPLIGKAHVESCLRHKVPVVSLFFGYSQEIVDALKDNGSYVLFQVGSLEESHRAINGGADGLIVQGSEAGGHVRSTERLQAMLSRIKDDFPARLIAGAGGVHNRASADAVRALGADAVASGTRFLATPESCAHPAYKARLLSATDTVLTHLFGVGWRDPHRVVPNKAVSKWCSPDGREPAWLRPLHLVLRALSRVASSEAATRKMIESQTLSLPLYTPSSLELEMDEALLEVVALYAGECVREISSLKPAAELVCELSECSDRSPAD